jgi:hypothetical protein
MSRGHCTSYIGLKMTVIVNLVLSNSFGEYMHPLCCQNINFSFASCSGARSPGAAYAP